MKKFILSSTTAAIAVAMLSASSFADTVKDDEALYAPQHTGPTVNQAAKTNLPAAAFKTYTSQTSIKAFDARYKEDGQGMADRR